MSKSIMYCCGSCGAIFEEPGAIQDEMGVNEKGTPRCVIITEVCPECGSGYFSEAERCPVCGRWHKENRGLSAMCDDCRDHIDTGVDELICWIREKNPKLDYESAKKMVHLRLSDLIEI